MLDQDIETEDALRLLTRPVGDEPVGPNGWTRRRFLQTVGAGAAAGMAIPTFAADILGFDLPEAWAGAPLGATEGVLVVVTFFGGHDGLNTVVPYTNPLYYSQRPGLAIAQSAALRLDDTFGLHPSLVYLQQLWQAGQLAVIHGVGNPEADLSHFTSMASWMAGRFGGGPPTSGWVGRWLDGLPADRGDDAGVAIGTGVSLQMQGAVRRGVAVAPNGSMFGAANEPSDRRMYDGLRAMAAPAGRGQWHDMTSRVLARQLDLARDVAPALTPRVTGSEMVRELTVAARLINADLGFRVIDIGLGGFDTHDNQAGKLAGLLQQFDDGLRAFFATLAPQFRSRVSLLTLSEFGRTSFSNGSAGTDHGTSNALFVIGPNVKGGHYGQPSSLNVKNRWDRMVPTTDYRHVLGTCLDRWLGGGATTVLRGAYTDLAFYRQGPGDPPIAPPPVVQPPGSGACEFVPLAPVRLFDTRDGTGGRLGALGGGESCLMPVRGQVGVPADAVAVVLNLTGVEATAPAFVTAWPSGIDRPLASTLNLVPGAPVPNLSVVRLGDDGQLALFCNNGSTHLVGDVAGYFRRGTNTGLVPLVPARLLDTRESPGAIGPGGTLDLVVAGRGGVAANATAVVLNVTVTEPSQGGYLTVWPSGLPRPLASNLNFAAGDTWANMVVCPVGAGGQVSLFNLAGATHVVVDVIGMAVPGAAGQFVSLAPSRVLDTRDGTGVAAQRVGQEPIRLAVLGAGGVPPVNVSAVLLNVTGVSPTASTYVTVYPAGVGRPTASTLNLPAGGVRPNGVLARLGDGGAIELYNNSGLIDLVADVVGYVTT